MLKNILVGPGRKKVNNILKGSQNLSTEDNIAIKVRGLTKKYSSVQAVTSIDFNVRLGELFGFLGPNGAGKTTTINMLTGLARPDSGSISYFGHDYTADIKKAQHLMGVVPDESNLYPELTGFENLCFCASLYGMARPERERRARELLESFGLGDAAHRKFAGYSRGMKRRLTIAAGIIHGPKILFLDEPTTGIDVASARNIRKLISDLKTSGTTVFLTTHYIEEAERLCDRIAFIVNGKIVCMDSTEGLLGQIQSNHIIELSLPGSSGEPLRGLRESFAEVNFEFPSKNTLRAITKTEFSLAPLIRFLEEQGITVTEARAIKPSLEDVFVKMTGIEAQRMKAEKEGKGKK
ncbi:MAG: ABC transporter ATP-binding protein [bacterium]